MRQRLSAALAAVLFLAVLPSAASAIPSSEGLDNFIAVNEADESTFSDIRPGDWYREDVLTAYEHGLMVGRGGGIFDPEGSVTLSEVLTVAARIHAIYHTGSAKAADNYRAGSPDSPGGQSAWYTPYVRYCTDRGVIRTAPADPGKAASRAIVASVLANAMPEEALPAINAVADNAVPDVEASPVTAGIYRLYRAGVLTGMDKSGAFQPLREIRRSELAAVLCRMIRPSARRSVTGLAGPGAKAVLPEEAEELLRAALITAYERAWGPYVPAVERPKTEAGAALPDDEYLAWVIGNLRMTEETEDYYVFPVTSSFLVDKLSGGIFRRGPQNEVVPFFPDEPDALTTPGGRAEPGAG